MPYESIEDLPQSVRNVLPEHALEIFLKAFNNAWDEYEDPQSRRGRESRDVVARKVAWAAVKKEYRKDEESGIWEKIR